MDRSEQDWWEGFKRGDETDFARVYQGFAPILLRYGIKIFRDRDAVEDSIQQVFLTLWRSRENVATPANIKNYLLKSLRSEMLKKLKHQNTYTSLPEDYTFETEASYETDLIWEQTQEQTKSRLEHLLAKLPPRQREVIFLKYYSNLKYEEIASIMGLEQESAYKLTYKAINRLYKLLNTTFSNSR
ncbi:RNA polymerase sigma factor [Pontibacter sp. CAU 1760]